MGTVNNYTMGCAGLYAALFMVFSATLVDSFTFPGDWHKIRQIMEGRMKKEELQVRFGSEDSKVMFSDEYEDISAYREIELATTTTTTTVQPPIELDPIMHAMMQTVNITE